MNENDNAVLIQIAALLQDGILDKYTKIEIQENVVKVIHEIQSMTRPMITPLESEYIARVGANLDE